LAVIRAVREAMPASMPLGMRISSTDWVEGGWDIEQTIRFVGEAQKLGVEFVCASSGGTAVVKIPVVPGYQVRFAEQIRRATGVKTRAVGAIFTPKQAENILTSGQADMIALARAFMDDPRWGWHAADVLGATAHSPSPYHLARSAGWKKLRDEARAHDLL
jgi:2,4-dienoyl-CoA reductase-like NADH-dependent reductase (Old Yellow Enzyme family)